MQPPWKHSHWSRDLTPENVFLTAKIPESDRKVKGVLKQFKEETNQTSETHCNYFNLGIIKPGN